MHTLRPLRLAGTLLLLLASIPAWAADYHGQVFYHGMPVPGATVVMTHGSQHAATVTDDQGFYDFPHIGNGSWKIKITMRGFTTLNAEVTVAPNTPQGHWELRMLTFSRLSAKRSKLTRNWLTVHCVVLETHCLNLRLSHDAPGTAIPTSVHRPSGLSRWSSAWRR